MIETTVGQLLEADDALKRLSNQVLPVKASYRIAKLLRTVQGEIATFNEQREKLIRAMGEETTVQGKPEIRVIEGRMPEFLKAITEIAGEPVKMENAEPLDLQILGDVPISALDIQKLGVLVTYGEDSK